MSKEHNYRGRRSESKEWVFGDLVHYILEDGTRISAIQEEWEVHPWNRPSPHSVIEETIGQYIGLKDKNGVSIYGGSKVKMGNEELFTVEWLKDGACWVMSGEETGKVRWFKRTELEVNPYGFHCLELEVVDDVPEKQGS